MTQTVRSFSCWFFCLFFTLLFWNDRLTCSSGVGGEAPRCCLEPTREWTLAQTSTQLNISMLLFFHSLQYTSDFQSAVCRTLGWHYDSQVLWDCIRPLSFHMLCSAFCSSDKYYINKQKYLHHKFALSSNLQIICFL